jgi:hypothetical protein
MSDHTAPKLDDPISKKQAAFGEKYMLSQKREHNGQYAFDGRLERVCVCGHTLAHHSAGSPTDCLFYALPRSEQVGQLGSHRPICFCEKFRESKTKAVGSH